MYIMVELTTQRFQQVMRAFVNQFTAALAWSLALGLAVSLASCSVGGASGGASSGALASPTATATAQPPCAVMLSGGSPAPFNGLASAPALTMPAGTYITTAASSGGGAGAYSVQSYTLCFQGTESQIAGPSGSTIAQLTQSGWTFNNLFPDPSNDAYLDYCSNAHNCLNTSGSPDPFTFVGFNNYVNHPGNVVTFQLQVATITAPTCVNDPQYYAGTPKYTLYYDGSSAGSSGGAPQNHFQMPPGTRVSTFQGGGTAGSTYVYFCSAGTQNSVVGFLTQAMSNDGWTISAASASGFTATQSSGGRTYTIAVVVQSPSNYYLRVFVPM
jgi:hypothetical protein